MFFSWVMMDILLDNSPTPLPSGIRTWDSLFMTKSGVREVVGSIPYRGNILRGGFHLARITGKVFSANK